MSVDVGIILNTYLDTSDSGSFFIDSINSSGIVKYFRSLRCIRYYKEDLSLAYDKKLEERDSQIRELKKELDKIKKNTWYKKHRLIYFLFVRPFVNLRVIPYAVLV